MEARVYGVLRTMEMSRGTEGAALGWTPVAGAANKSHVPGLLHYIMIFVSVHHYGQHRGQTDFTLPLGAGGCLF